MQGVAVGAEAVNWCAYPYYVYDEYNKCGNKNPAPINFAGSCYAGIGRVQCLKGEGMGFIGYYSGKYVFTPVGRCTAQAGTVWGRGCERTMRACEPAVRRYGETTGRCIENYVVPPVVCYGEAVTEVCDKVAKPAVTWYGEACSTVCENTFVPATNFCFGWLPRAGKDHWGW